MAVRSSAQDGSGSRQALVGNRLFTEQWRALERPCKSAEARGGLSEAGRGLRTPTPPAVDLGQEPSDATLWQYAVQEKRVLLTAVTPSELVDAADRGRPAHAAIINSVNVHTWQRRQVRFS